MKHLKLFEELINEIGDAGAKPYKWKWMDGRFTSYAQFKTDSGLTYKVNTEIDDRRNLNHGIVLEIEYGIEDKTSKSSPVNYEIVTNRGELFRVMATVVDIVKAFMKKYPEVEYIEFEGSKNRDGDQRRNKLYMAYIKKHIKSKSIEDDGNTITVEL